MNYQYISLLEKPELLNQAAHWFSRKWHVPTEAYLKCMTSYINHETDFGWYLCLHDNEIIGGLGVIENDFHVRKDLSPNICAVYVDQKYRNQGIAGKLLNKAVNDLKSKGITPVYLITDHTNFYERYGWKFLCMVEEENGNYTRMYVHY